MITIMALARRVARTVARGGAERRAPQAAVGWTVVRVARQRAAAAARSPAPAPAIRLRDRMIRATPTTITAAGDELERRDRLVEDERSPRNTATTGLTKA